ncbi:MAG: hypothetical protein HY265_05010, partial [Deltaproteobacteria bacterium]|nr:hypothetical protein [Deltaproteobacteria bacterium]
YDTKNAGTGKTLTASGTVNDGNSGNNYTYTFVTDTTGVINTAALTVTASNGSKTYDGLAYTGGNGVGYTGFVNGETSSVLGGTLAYTGTSQGATNAGSYVITPGGQTSGNYTITFANGALTVNPAALTITAQTNTKTYDGNTSVVTAPTITSGTLFGTDTANFSETYDNQNAGTAKTLTASGTVNDGNSGNNYTYTFITDTTGVITPAALTVTADNKSKTYGDANPALTATYSGLKGSDTSSVVSGLTLNTTAATGSNVGSYTITAADGTATNYTITYNNGALTVTPAALTITADNQTKVYGDANPALTATYSGLKGTDTSAVVSGLNISTTATTGSNVGSYTITAANGTATNYIISYVNGILLVTAAPSIITPAPVTITAAPVATTASYTNVIQEGLGNFGGNELNEQAAPPAKFEGVYASADSSVFTFTENGLMPLIRDEQILESKHLHLIVKRDGNPAIVEGEAKKKEEVKDWDKDDKKKGKKKETKENKKDAKDAAPDTGRDGDFAHKDDTKDANDAKKHVKKDKEEVEDKKDAPDTGRDGDFAHKDDAKDANDAKRHVKKDKKEVEVEKTDEERARGRDYSGEDAKKDAKDSAPDANTKD